MRQIFILICVAFAPFLRGQVAQDAFKGDIPSVEELREQLQSLKSKYVANPILPDSEDYKVFGYLAKNLEIARILVPELIGLTGIRQKRPNTTESLSAYRLSPAGGVLLSLGDAAEPAIKQQLTQADLTEGQKEVLNHVIRTMETLRKRSALETK